MSAAPQVNLVSPRPEWMPRGACAIDPKAIAFFDPDDDPHFPADGTSRQKNRWAAAKRVCAGCPVLRECRSFVLAAEAAGRVEFGCWGGLSEDERRELLRRQAA